MPFVVYLDAVGVTSNKRINLLNEKEGTYVAAMKKVCEQLTKKYENELFVYAVSDELSICVIQPELFLMHFDTNHTVFIEDIKDMILQEVFELFSRLYKPLYFHSRIFSLYPQNIYSYIIWRKHQGCNAMMYYFLSRKSNLLSSARRVSYKSLEQVAVKKVPGFKERNAWAKEGLVFQSGKPYLVEELLTKQIEKGEERMIMPDEKQKATEAGQALFSLFS